jgi:hypothetical protein
VDDAVLAEQLAAVGRHDDERIPEESASGERRSRESI